MGTISKGVVMPTGSELPSIRDLTDEFGTLVRVNSWLHPLLYALKLAFFVLFVFPPAALLWFAYIAAKGDINYLIAEVSGLLQSTNASELTASLTDASCVVALFGVLFVALYVFLFPYRRSSSYIVASYKDSDGNEHKTRVPAQGAR